MPSLITTIEENSPLITYLGGWATGTSADNLASRYSESSFVATQTPGASASFVFNGTGVQIFGAKRENHGPYVVKVDNQVYPTADGNAPGPGLFQQSLFNVDGLQQGRHEVTITNQGTKFLDIDFITWTTDVGKPSDKIFVNTVQDTDPSFSYSPASAWNSNPKNVGSFLGGSGHATTDPGASFMYTFQGEAVSLYGPVGLDGASYTIQLDGSLPQNFTSNKELSKTQVLLYHANNLPSGQHHIKLTSQPTVSGQVFAIDYANVYTTMPPQAVNEAGLSAGSIVGITLSIVGTFGVLVALFLFLRRRTRREQYAEELDAGPYDSDKQASRAATISSFGPGPATSNPRAAHLTPTPFPMSASPLESSLRSVFRGASLARLAPAWRVPSSEPRLGKGGKRGKGDKGDKGVRFPEPLQRQEAIQPPAGKSEHQVYRDFPGRSSSNSPMPMRKLPTTPKEVHVHTELGDNHHTVAGRAHDLNPSSPTASIASSPRSSSHAEEERSRDGLPPPDYSQATQKYTR